jgi:hypothetical protein
MVSFREQKNHYLKVWREFFREDVERYKKLLKQKEELIKWSGGSDPDLDLELEAVHNDIVQDRDLLVKIKNK